LFKIKPGPQRLHGHKVYIEPEWKQKLAEVGITKRCNWLKLNIGTPVSKSNRVNAYKVDLDDGSSIYFKTYSFHGQLKDYFMRQSKCAVEVNSYQTLKEIGIPTIKPLAFGEDRVAGMLKSCCIVTLGEDNTTQLEDWAKEVWLKLPVEEKKKAFNQIFQETAKYTRMAHEAGFFHYDLKWRNIIIKKENGNYKTIWIDCPRGKKMSLREERGRMVDLSSLSRLALSYLSKSQRMRFLYTYYGENADKREVRKMWKLVSDHLSRRQPEILDLDQLD